MIAKNDLEKLAQVRLEDALALFAAARYSGAYYLAGYSIELAIKACIANVFQAAVIPDKSLVNAVYSHSLDGLLATAGLKKALQDDMKHNPDLAVAWGIASKWSETSRYASWDQFAALGIITATADPSFGVLQWLKKHW